jgi:PKD repeat protein/Leucine-rich repeat (LRR) protein
MLVDGSWVDADFNNWEGINMRFGYFDNPDVKIIYLRAYDLKNTLPLELNNLTALIELDLDWNYLNSPIPSILEDLSRLEVLGLDGNNFIGELPSFIFNHENLSSIQFGDNKFDRIPNVTVHLPSLAILDLSGNEFTGEVPDNILNISTPEGYAIYLSDNGFYGDIASKLNSEYIYHDFTIDNNNFIFTDILPVIHLQNLGVIYQLSYFVQSKIDESISHVLNPGQSYSLSSNIDRSTDPQCKYQWFKYVDGINDIPLIPEPTVDGHTYTFSNITSDDNGEYYYIIINDAAPVLTLQSYNREIIVLDCPNIMPNPTFITNADCNQAGNANIVDGCFDGWSPVTGTPNKSGEGFYIWGKPGSNNTEALLAFFEEPLEKDKEYVIEFDYKVSSLSGYDRIVENAYIELSNSLEYRLQNGNTVTVTEPNGVSAMASSMALSDSASMESSSIIQMAYIIPGAIDPENVIDEDGNIQSRVLEINGATNTTDFVNISVRFTPTQQSKYMYFSIFPNEGSGFQGIQIRNINLVKIEDCGPVCTELTPEINYEVIGCSVNFLPLIDNPNTCTISSYAWDFGDGNTSTEQEPVHFYDTEATYTVSFTIEYDCNDDCGLQAVTVTEDIVYELNEDQFEELPTNPSYSTIDNVLSASVTTFSDTWLMDLHDNQLANKHPLNNGQEGVWRTAGSYVFDAHRKATTPQVDISEDGTFTLNTFDWGMEELAIVPGWKKVNTVTEYSPYGFELENRDILGRHSAAVYGYHEQLPVAIGQNAEKEELAFSSFEEQTGDLTTGNWQFGNKEYRLWKHGIVYLGIRNAAVVNLPLETFNGVETVMLRTLNIVQNFRFEIRGRIFRDVKIMCKSEYDDDPTKTFLVFDQLINEGPWFGKLYISKPSGAMDDPVFSNVTAHSGKTSLAVNGTKTFRQEVIRLTPGKEYMINAWASINNPVIPSPVLPEGIKISLTFYDIEENELTTAEPVEILPQKYMIEEWQLMEGKFIVPENTEYFKITFDRGGTGTVYFDDLRLHPVEGNMNTYVYDNDTYRLQAELDANHYATYYYYDDEGTLYLIKKETEKGVKTLQESINYQVEVSE